MKTKRRQKRTYGQLARELYRTRKALADALVREGSARLHSTELLKGVVYLLSLRNQSNDGKWSYATVARIDAARALAGLPPVQYQPKPLIPQAPLAGASGAPPSPDLPADPAPAAPQIQPPAPPPHLTHVELLTPTA